jgi:hypothetical protein
MSDDDEFVEVKVHRDKVGTTTARKIVKQGAKALVSYYEVTPGAKVILDENGVIYFENVDPKDLEVEGEVE